jgi:predicted nuclease of predicted toxin-antitoxin system
MIWLDAHLSPALARWIQTNCGEKAEALRDIGLRDADDLTIFNRAREEKVIFMTKDKDFADLINRLGSPPQVIWLRCGNTSEENLKHLLGKHLAEALRLLAEGDDLVELR